MTARPARIAVLAYAGVLNRSGYARRVLDSALSLRRALPDAEVVVASVETPRNLRRRDDRVAVTECLRAAGAALHVIHAGPRRWGLRGLSDRLAANALGRLVRRSGLGVIHAHGPDALRLALDVARGTGRRVVADVHGDRAAEAAFEHGIADAAPDARDVADVATADAVVQASAALARRFPAGEGKPSAVVPCLVADTTVPDDVAAESRRSEARRRLHLAGDERVVAYAGSLAACQELPRLAAILRHAADRVPQLRVLLVTPDPAAAKALFAPAGFRTGVVASTSAAAGGVVEALAAADAGVLLAKDAEANRVRSPIKLGEYLATGLEVVASDNVPFVTERLAAAPGLGHLLPWSADDATWAARIAGAARAGTAAERAARRDHVRRHLVASTADEAYRRVYASLADAAGAASRSSVPSRTSLA